MKILFYVIFAVYLTSCGQNHTPKPYGFYRVDLPPNRYVIADTVLPFRFHISEMAELQLDSNNQFWMNIVYPTLNAIIHSSYKPVTNNIYYLTEDAHRLVYKHAVRADDITEQFFSNPSREVYGVFYTLKGNAASNAQFVLTDSVNHFVRGALYFNHAPNKDSIAPMAEFIKRDIKMLMESFEWK